MTKVAKEVTRFISFIFKKFRIDFHFDACPDSSTNIMEITNNNHKKLLYFYVLVTNEFNFYVKLVRYT